MIPKLAFDSMPRFSFRGVSLPVLSRELSKAHEPTNQKIPYGRGQIVNIESTGNRVFTYRLVASDALKKFGYFELFTVELRRMWVAIDDKSPGPLIDPVEGELMARPLSIVDVLDPTRDREGSSVDLRFEEYLTLEQIEAEANEDQSFDWAVNESIQLDTQVATVDWQQRVPEQLTSKSIEWTQATPPQPSVNPIDALTGIFRKIDRALARPGAILGDAARRLEQLDKSFDALHDPKRTAATAASARRLHLSVQRLIQTQESGQRRLVAKRTPWPMTTLGVVQWLGTTLDAFLQLNPRLARRPVVPQGTLVRVFR